MGMSASSSALYVVQGGAGKISLWNDGSVNLLSRIWFLANADGVLQVANNAISDFGRLQFGGTTSSFPALKRSTTDLHVKLADDSAFTNMQAKYKSSDGSAGVSAGPFTAITGITVKDGLITALTGS
jgi:type 1 fimbria pilin